MTLKYLMDENVDPIYANQIRRINPNLTILSVGDVGTPPKSTLDPDILLWCEEYNYILVTNNRKSMPVHLNEHLAKAGHIPGIFILNPNLSAGQNIDELILIAEYAFENEYEDQIVHLPLTY